VVLTVNDRPVLPLQGGAIPVKYKDGRSDAFYVGSIYDAVKKEVDKQKYIAQYNQNAPFAGRVNIVADKKISYRTLMEVLYTAGQAELGEYKFMVMKNE
jgi:biopolymer transport protein ExbD